MLNCDGLVAIIVFSQKAIVQHGSILAGACLNEPGLAAGHKILQGSGAGNKKRGGKNTLFTPFGGV